MAETELWLSRLRMNTRSTEVRRDLRGVVDMHRTVMSMYPDVDADAARQEMGVLHRLDIVNERPVLLIQSSVKPDLSKLPHDYGEVAIVSLRDLFAHLGEGTPVRYRLLANATKKPRTGPMAGKRVALGASDAVKWWGERAAACGLTLPQDPTTVKESLSGGSSKEARVTLRPWRLDGVAFVNDTVKLEAGMRAGFGRGRAYGCGLLSLAAIHSGLG